MIGAMLEFIAGAIFMGIICYIKDYAMDSLYLKGYSREYKKALEDLQKEEGT